MTAAVAALFGLLGLVLLSGCGSVAAPPEGIGTPLDQTLPASITGLHLLDSTGKTRSLASLEGKVVMLQDSMTLCQETCPMDTEALVDTARRADAAGLSSKLVFLTVTVDPQRDTVPQIAAYRKLYGGPSNWLTLTGRPAAINALWDKLGVFRKKVPSDKPAPHNWRTGAKLTYDVQHSDDVFFLDAKGHERFVIEGMPTATKAGIPKKIYTFLSKEGIKNLHAAGDWTSTQALSVLAWLTNHKIAS
jgi:cytochrome oxidase Cu insertion factor (SCO1/SenC/PrrC family)